MTKSVYIASSLKNYERVVQVNKRLHDEFGVITTYDWTPHAVGVLEGNPEKDPQKLREIAYREFQGIINAGVMLIVMPGRLGTHFEYGLAFGIQVPIVYLDDRDMPSAEKRFEPIHFLQSVYYYDKEDEALQKVNELAERAETHPIADLQRGKWPCYRL